MSELNILDHRVLSEGSHPIPTCEIARAFISTQVEPRNPLWVYRVRLDRGGSVRWSGRHDNEALLLTEGSMTRETEDAAVGDAIIVERNVSTAVVSREGCEFLHFGGANERYRGPLGPPGESRRTSYVVHGEERPARESVSETGVRVTISYWADSKSLTSRLALFEVTAAQEHRAPSHSHSADEIICMLDGELSIGRNTLSAGMSIFIPRDFRYGFTAKGPYRFVNFRADSSLVTTRPKDPPVLETADGRGT